MPVLDWSQCPAVESVPVKVSGAGVLHGTRMPVAAIFENIDAGANIDDLMEWFDGLDREQVKAVIEFCCPQSRYTRSCAPLMRVLKLVYRCTWMRQSHGLLQPSACCR